MQTAILEYVINLIFGWIKSAIASKSTTTSVAALPAATTKTETAIVINTTLKTTILTKIPMQGETNDDVETIQIALNKAGAKLDADKEFGQLTHDAVSAFQKTHGLTGSGIIGDNTVKLLGLTVKGVPVVVAPVVTTNGYIPPSHDVVGTRKLRKELEKIVDDHLVANHLTDLKSYIDKKDGNKICALFNLSMTELKVKEATGNNDGTMVSYLQDTVGSPMKQSWCEDQQQSAIAYAEKKLGIKSRAPATESTIYMHDNCPKDMLVNVANSEMGDQWVWQHGTAYAGHTECFDHWLEVGKVAVNNGGNTTSGFDPNGEIVRNGGGSFQTHRSVNPIGDMHLIAVVRPFDKVV